MTMLWLAVAAAFLTGVAILGPAAPALGSRRTARTQTPDDGDDRRLSILRGLRDLEADHVRGALSDVDYAALRARMEKQAIELLREAKADVVLEVASAVRASRSSLKGKRNGTSRRRKNGHRPVEDATQPRDRRAWAAGIAISGVVALGAVVALAGAVSSRGQGGFITGIVTGNSSATDPAAVVAQNPGNVEARLELAQLDLERGQVSDATNQYLTVLKLDPKNPEARTRLALLLYESGDSKDALKGVDAVLTDNPTWPEALFLKGVVLLNGLNRPSDAIAPLEAYLRVDPNGPYSNDAAQLLQQAKGK